MSAEVFNRIAGLEARVLELETLLTPLLTQAKDNALLTSNPRTQAGEVRPHTLSLRKKADTSHA